MSAITCINKSATNFSRMLSFAVGGIGPENVREVVAAGARRVAVSSCLAEADDPEPVARVLRAALEG